MKPFAAFVSSLLLSTAIFAQEEIATETKVTEQSTAQEKRRLETRKKGAQVLEKKTITFSGFFVDFTQAQDKKTLLSLRQPVDVRRDLEHVHLDYRTGKPKGFVLLALSF